MYLFVDFNWFVFVSVRDANKARSSDRNNMAANLPSSLFPKVGKVFVALTVATATKSYVAIKIEGWNLLCNEKLV